MPNITIPVNGVDVVIQVTRNSTAQTVSMTFLAPPGAGGPTQSQSFASKEKICSEEAENNCTYCFYPKPPLTWGEVSSANDLVPEASCTA